MNIKNVTNNPIYNIQQTKQRFIKPNETLKADSISFTGSVTPSDKMSVYAIELLTESKLKENQPVYIEADSKYLPFMNILAQEAYKKGSGYVKIVAKEPELENLKRKYHIKEEFDYKKQERKEFENALKLSFDDNNNPYKKAGLKEFEVKSEIEKIYPPMPKNIRTQFKINPEEIFKTALDIHKGQPIMISGEREHLPYIIDMVDYLYSKNDSKLVDVTFSDENIIRDVNLLKYGKEELLEQVPQSKIESYKEYYKKDVARLFLDGEDPNALEGVDSKRILKRSLAFSEPSKKYRNLMTANNPWLVYYAPTTKSCKEVYPEIDNPTKRISKAYKDANKINRIGNLEEHVKTLQSRADKMNELMNEGYRTLHYVSVNPETKEPDGKTDFRITMSDKSLFKAARENMEKFGHNPIVNIPTEEVFTAPLANSAQGKIAATMPLVLNGKVVDDIVLTFKDGKVIKVSASKNEEMLKEHIKSHKNADKLGEVALVAGSPIAKTGRLFKSTLLDENAACHLALGDAYPDCIDGAMEIDDYEEQQKFLKELNINSSTTHDDFMVGGPNVYIYAENNQTGDEIEIIKDDKFLLS
ncbi:MAG: aminopeptidase [Candidatus Gastranaerophilales bacterium]|nr:aminopeptidase [Candidatus Gastranaerophilales bacterium]